MAPLTRSRAGAGDAVGVLDAEYIVAQRASAGLIVSEATFVSPQAKGYLLTPGIYTEEQVAGWKVVTDAVHAKGGKIVAQLWHVGRISHPSLQPDGALPVAPSALKPEGQAFTASGFQPLVTRAHWSATRSRSSSSSFATRRSAPAARASTGSKSTARTPTSSSSS